MFNKLKAKSRTSEQTLLTQSFTYAGIGFLTICVIGIMTWGVLDKGGVLSGLKNMSQYDLSVLVPNAQHTAALQNVARASMFSFALIIGSSILSIFWMFRMKTASRTFIYIVLTTYIIGQGLGFGILFTVLKASQLFMIFGIGGGIFSAMAFIGYVSNDLSGMGRYLFAGFIVSMFLSVIILVMTVMGVYSDFMWTFYMFLTSVLFIAYIAFDVNWIKRTSQNTNINMMEGDDRFRLVSFFAFRLMSDLVSVIWRVAYFVLRSQG